MQRDDGKFEEPRVSGHVMEALLNKEKITKKDKPVLDPGRIANAIDRKLVELTLDELIANHAAFAATRGPGDAMTLKFGAEIKRRVLAP